MKLNDTLGRNLHYLRISVTDRCNLRCRYCMPAEGVPWLPHENILTYEEILRLARLMAGLGVDRLRLTGGEPLVRKDVVALAAELRAIPGIKFLGITTNGVLLEEMAKPLCDAGVDGLNISLDTTSPARYAAITGFDRYADVMRGLNAALALPFLSVRLNSVLSPQSTPEDWLGVIALAKDLPIDVRLIEWMPMAGDTEATLVRADEALAQVEQAYGKPVLAQSPSGQGPATYYQLPGFAGRLGVIPAMSHSFCSACNRIRLTATGDLKLCLFYDTGIALRPLLRGGASDEEIKAAVLEAVTHKPQQHQGQKLSAEDGCDANLIDQPCAMYKIGG